MAAEGSKSSELGERPGHGARSEVSVPFRCQARGRGPLLPRHAMGLDLARHGSAPMKAVEGPLATPEQPLSPFTDDPTNGGRRNMRGRERQPLRLRSIEPRGPCAAPLLRIIVAG